MKKPLHLYLSVSALLLTLLISFSGSTFAQKAGDSVEGELSKLTQTLEKLLIKKEVSSEKERNLMAAQDHKIPVDSCIDNYKSKWKKSNTYDSSSDWNMLFMARKPHYGGSADQRSLFEKEQFIDLNGDGLVDYLYSDRHYYGASTFTSQDLVCVYLNNGSGFDEVFKCVIEAADVNDGKGGTVYKHIYYGDCAK